MTSVPDSTSGPTDWTTFSRRTRRWIPPARNHRREAPNEWSLIPRGGLLAAAADLGFPQCVAAPLPLLTLWLFAAAVLSGSCASCPSYATMLAGYAAARTCVPLRSWVLCESCRSPGRPAGVRRAAAGVRPRSGPRRRTAQGYRPSTGYLKAQPATLTYQYLELQVTRSSVAVEPNTFLLRKT